MLPELSSTVEGAIQEQIERLQSIIHQNNACQAIQTSESRNDNISTVLDTLPVGKKSLVDDLLFPRKDPRLCRLRTLSADRLQTLFQVGHQRCLSGDTLVEVDDQQTRVPTSHVERSSRNSSIQDQTGIQLELLMQLPFYNLGFEDPGQWESLEVALFKELPFYNAVLEDSEQERIGAVVEAEWKVVLKFKGKLHYQEMAELKEDHEDTIRSLHESSAESMALWRRRTQKFKLENKAVKAELKSSNTLCDELKKKLENTELHDEHSAETRPNEHTLIREENARLRGVIVFMQDIGRQKVTDLYYQLLEKDIITNDVFQQKSRVENELLEKDIVINNIFQQKAQVENELQDRDFVIHDLYEQKAQVKNALAQAAEENHLLSTNWAKDKEAFDSNFRQLQFLTAIQEQEPEKPAEIQKLLDYKNKQFSDLEKRAGEAVTALRKEEIQSKLGLELSAKRIGQIEQELEKERLAVRMLRYSKEDYKKTSQDILGMLRMRLTESDVNNAMSRFHNILLQDNAIMASGAKEQEHELLETRARISAMEIEGCNLRLALQESEARNKQLEVEKQATDIASEELKWKLDLLPEEHREVVTAKDATITDLQQCLSIRNQQFAAMECSSSDDQTLAFLRDKGYQIGYQKNEIDRLSQVVRDLETQLNELRESQRWDFACVRQAQVQEYAMSQRLQQLTNEVERLHEILTEKDLASEPDAGDTDSYAIDALKEELAAVRQQRDTRNDWLNELTRLALQLLARMRSIETQLRLQGLEVDNDERAALMLFCCDALRPHGLDVSELTANDEAQKEAVAKAAAKPTTDGSKNWLQGSLDAPEEDSYLKQAALEGSEFARALLAKAAAEKKQGKMPASESPRDRMLRQAAASPSMLLNHDSQGTVLRVETRGSNPPVQVEEYEFLMPERSWMDLLP